jgi:glycosyltransferase involved in cell wall biosynthesis
MAMGRPILAGVRGEAADIVVGCGAGVAVVPQDVAAMAAGMVQMAGLSSVERARMGERARAAYEVGFSYLKGMEATVTCLGRPELAR